MCNWGYLLGPVGAGLYAGHLKKVAKEKDNELARSAQVQADLNKQITDLKTVPANDGDPVTTSSRVNDSTDATKRTISSLRIPLNTGTATNSTGLNVVQ